jgi:hypothetical protein
MRASLALKQEGFEIFAHRLFVVAERLGDLGDGLTEVGQAHHLEPLAQAGRYGARPCPLVQLLALLGRQLDPDDLGHGRVSSCHSFYEESIS